MRSGPSLMLHSFSYHFVKQLRSGRNQWSCLKKNLKGLKDKVCGSSRITSIRIPSSENLWYSQKINNSCWKKLFHLNFPLLTTHFNSAIAIVHCLVLHSHPCFPFPVLYSSFPIPHFSFLIPHSSFPINHSHSPFPILYFPFLILHSSSPIPHFYSSSGQGC